MARPTMARVLRISSCTVIRSGRFSRVFHRKAISRNSSALRSSSAPRGRWWLRMDNRRAISFSRSSTLRRRISVGWAVSTGVMVTRVIRFISASRVSPWRSSMSMAAGRVRGRSSLGAASKSA
jgi:hypothetical protein